MTYKEILKQMIKALEANRPINYCENGKGDRFPMFENNPFRQEANEQAIQAGKQVIKELESQEPVVLWPCHIIEADFHERTITLGMECGDYKVSAGTHWLSTHPPQRTEQEPVAHCTVRPLRGDESYPKTEIVWAKGRPIAGALYTHPPQPEHNYKKSLEAWLDKTEWVQETVKPHELGMHRADVLKQRIEEASPQRTEQEPTTGNILMDSYKAMQSMKTAAKPQRTWVGLTDEEIDYQAKKDDHGAYFALGALWAGAKLKEKNNGT